MNEKHLQFLDYVLPILGDCFPDSKSLNYLAHNYNKDFGIYFDGQEIEAIASRYDGLYFNYEPTMNEHVSITNEYLDIIEKFKKLSLYLEDERERSNVVKDREELEIIVLSLEKEKLEYEKENEGLNNRIRNYEAQNELFQVVRNYWWLLSILIALGYLIGQFVTLFS